MSTPGDVVTTTEVIEAVDAAVDQTVTDGPASGGTGDVVTTQMVQSAAALAALPLTEDRAAALAELLTAWVPAANVLSARMMQAEHLRGLMPAVVFTQGVIVADGADQMDGRAGG